MKKIWDWIDKKNWSEQTKYKVIITLFFFTFAAAGLCLWSVVQIWALNHWSWMVIFTGYPALFALVSIIIYSLNHSFHNKA